MILGIFIGATVATVFWMFRLEKLQALRIAMRDLTKKAHDAADTIRKA